MEIVASLSQGRTAAAQCGLFTHKSVPVIFEPPCTINLFFSHGFFLCYKSYYSTCTSNALGFKVLSEISQSLWCVWDNYVTGEKSMYLCLTGIKVIGKWQRTVLLADLYAIIYFFIFVLPFILILG